MQLPPTILSIDKSDNKRKDQARSGITQSSSNNNTERKKQKEPDSKSRFAQQSPDLVEIATESLMLSDSDSENSSNGDHILNGNEPAQATPSSQTSSAKIADTSKTRTKHTGLRPPRTLETTLFDRLEKMYGSGIKRMLKVQYRSVTISNGLA